MKTRFAPSPTGFMHLGNARTALFSMLAAKSQKAPFLLRIEDTDQSRSEKRFEIGLMEDLAWIGCQWDEGPYHQSERHDIFAKYYDQLVEAGHAYPCFCSESHLALTRKAQRAAGQAPRYPGTCRYLSESERAEKIAQGIKPTLRFKMPKDRLIQFTDLVRGDQRYEANDIGDFIIRRADGTAAFMYCNAIDDAMMGVTHVLRGEDHLTNTPRQLLILEALGLTAPTYAHISLITGSDGAPLSKRNGSQSIADLRAQHYFPLAITNYMARLGHYYAEHQLYTFAELAEHFSFERLSKSAARFEPEQLDHWQKLAIAQTSDHDLLNWLLPETQALIPAEKQASFIQLVRENASFPQEAHTWAEICFSTQSFQNTLQDPAIPDGFFQAAAEALTAHGLEMKAISTAITSACGCKGKALFHPLRLALTGRSDGPKLGELLNLIGQEQVAARFAAAQKRNQAVE